MAPDAPEIQQETPDFVEVETNLSPEQEAAELNTFLEDRGIHLDKMNPSARPLAEAARAEARRARRESGAPSSSAVVTPENDGDGGGGALETVAQPAAAPAAPPVVLTESEMDALIDGLLREQVGPEPAVIHPAQQRVNERAGKRIQELERREARYMEVLTGILAGMRSSDGGAPGVAPGGEPGLPDILEDPDAHIQGVVRPLMETQEQRISRIEQQNELAALEHAEASYERANPGYLNRVAQAEERFKTMLRGYGAPDEEIEQACNARVHGILAIAGRYGVNPAIIADDQARTMLGLPARGAAATLPAPLPPATTAGTPPARRVAAPPNPVAAARAAATSPAAGGVTGGGRGPLRSDDVQALIDSNVSRDQIAQVFAKGGRRGFLALMGRMERQLASRE